MATSHLWILIFFTLSSLSLSLTERCHPNDKKALLQIKKALNNPKVLISWDSKTDCCKWDAVECNDKTNRITEIDISDAKLNLPIPAAVGDLPFLQRLTFRNNSATGPIPRSISKLSELISLSLEYNFLTGPVPADVLGHLKKLIFIGLSHNRLTGSIPASLSQLPKLGALSLDGNRLTGGNPETFAGFKDQDFRLDLSHNKLSGPIPRKLGYAPITEFKVAGNFLQGDISFLFGKDKKMVTGDFSRNKFAFDLTYVEFPQSLGDLDLSHNKIYGGIPKDLSSTGIILLNVSYNSLCGPIPELRYRFQNFDASVFSHNKCLCGKPLPACK